MSAPLLENIVGGMHDGTWYARKHPWQFCIVPVNCLHEMHPLPMHEVYCNPSYCIWFPTHCSLLLRAIVVCCGVGLHCWVCDMGTIPLTE